MPADMTRRNGQGSFTSVIQWAEDRHRLIQHFVQDGQVAGRMARPAAMYSNIFIGLHIWAVFPPLEVATVRS